MSGATATAAGDRQRGPALITVGMILFLGSELMFFAALFAMYFTLRSQAAQWPPPGVQPDVLQTGVFTIALIGSSGTMQAAIRRIRSGDRRGLVRWTWLTLVLGTSFLAGQAWSYARATFHVSTGAYGSAFYTMTGFHALHVLAGLILMLVVLGRAAAGAYSADEHAGAEAVAYYWHFVDIVWIGLYATIYLLR